YLTGYYTRVEPASLLVCELDGVVKGYLMGCRRPLIKQTYQAFANVAVAATAIHRCYARPYNESSRTFLRWVLRNAWRELPVAPRSRRRHRARGPRRPAPPCPAAPCRASACRSASPAAAGTRVNRFPAPCRDHRSERP